MKFRARLLPIIFLFSCSLAEAKLCNPIKERCFGYGNGSSTKPAYPSKSSGININPSAVPVEDAFGIESIIFDGVDLSIVKGTGRIGAAISASNGEDTFFGPPAFELEEDYVERKQKQEKYKSQKVSLATAIGILSNKRQGLRRFEVNLGVGGKYNRISKKAMPGGGVSGIAGPITFGYSLGRDQTTIELDPQLFPGVDPVLQYDYNTETVSAGIYLNTVAVDYSRMTLKPKDEYDDPNIRITLITGSLILKRLILTVAQRTQESDADSFFASPLNDILYVKKEDVFGGVQFTVTKVLLIGGYYNYYLHNEVAFGATLFF